MGLLAGARPAARILLTAELVWRLESVATALGAHSVPLASALVLLLLLAFPARAPSVSA